jgi:hypothetical protein
MPRDGNHWTRAMCRARPPGADEFGSPVTYDYPTPKKLSGEVSWVEIDLGEAAVNLDHLITPEQRLSLAVGTQ